MSGFSSIQIDRFDRALRELDPRVKVWVTRGLVVAGVGPLAIYASWWLEGGRFLALPLLPAFVLAAAYLAFQVVAAWYVYWRIEIPEDRVPRPGLTVDVFVPVLDEDPLLAGQALSAVRALTYPHRAFVLDDGPRPEIRALALEYGATYLVRPERLDNKAGNVNHALAASSGEFVAIFDVDHLPEPGYLDAALGHFDDGRVGFVQLMVGYRNQAESFIARAASGQADDVFGPTSMGFHGCGAALVWGAHTVFRRQALESIGGYRPGLAEDLNTSLALHAAGWRSVYVPRLLARGLAPVDLHGHMTQHLKWSRGVLGTLLGMAPAQLARLTPSQTLAYLVRMTYYLVGLVSVAHMILLAWALFSDADVNEYLYRCLMLAGTLVVVRKVVGAMWERDPRSGWQVTGTALAVVAWPTYVASLLAALIGVRFRHRPTPKQRAGVLCLPALLPQLAMLLALVGGLLVAAGRHGRPFPVLAGVLAAMTIAGHWVLVRGGLDDWRARRATAPPPGIEQDAFRGTRPSPAVLSASAAPGGSSCES